MNPTHALGWALVHFLWQGGVLAMFLGVALALTRPRAARTRYALSLLTLGAMLVLPITTTVRLYTPTIATSERTFEAPTASTKRETRRSPAPQNIGKASIERPASPVPRLSAVKALVDPALPWLVALWVGGVLLLSVRLMHGWLAARRLRITGTRPPPAPLVDTLHQLAARLRVTRPVQLVESLIIEVPAVTGWLRPVILVPSSAMTGLTPQQLDVLLAHELAHVRRHDYLVNIIQSVIETLLFYHPAVWWVSRRVRAEREHCCDDVVVQVCGDAHLYASALVGMERLRPVTPRLALAATDGSLLNRVRRLVLPTVPRAEFFPRWAAGIAAVVAVTIALLATGGDRVSAEILDSSQAWRADTTRMAPDTVLLHPDPSQPLAQRWEWARTQARRLAKRTFWIGYTVTRPEWLEHSMYVDRGTEVMGPNIRLSGRLFGNFQGLAFRGVRLGPLVKSADSDDITILLGFTMDQSGKTVLVHVHVASFYLPVDFRGRSLFWLGSAPEAQSLPMVQELFSSTQRAELREDLVSAIGIHGSSDTVVPILQRILTSREPTDVRAQAAEWLGFHPTRAAVTALSAAARNDAVSDVRREAAEALGDNTLPAATDSTIAVARTAGDAEARRAAVEGLAQKDSERALPALISIAKTDRDADVQREAVETLGELPNSRGLNAVRDIARTHQNSDVRREAVETLGEKLPPAEAVTTLKELAASDSDPDVARQAIESLGELTDNPGALAAITDFARTHPSSDARRKAVETLGEMAPTAETVGLLATLATSDRSEDVQRQAIETLGEMGDTRALGIVARIARGQSDVDVRRKAIETYTESAPVDSVLALFKEMLATDAPEDISSKILESLEEMDNGAGIPMLIDVARAHPNRDVRADALRRLAESDDPRAQQIFERTLRRP